MSAFLTLLYVIQQEIIFFLFHVGIMDSNGLLYVTVKIAFGSAHARQPSAQGPTFNLFHLKLSFLLKCRSSETFKIT